MEPLEARQLLSATVRSIDGTGNNLADPLLGSAGVDLLRQAPANYGNGISTPTPGPSARAISNAVAAQSGDVLNSRFMSDMVTVWGQFIDHDLDLTTDGQPVEPLFIPIPAGDPVFDPAGTGGKVMGMNRSLFDPATGKSTSNPRQQINQISAWLDGGMVYGSDPTRAAALRTFEGGKLKLSADGLMPLNTGGLPNANDVGIDPDNQLFLGGDVRANENPELTALNTLFVREHNRVADMIAAAHPDLTDEGIYQRARAWVIAEMQAITYNEFLPALLGQNAIKPYAGYDPSVDPGVSTEFSTAAYRIGHTIINDNLQFITNKGKTLERMPLASVFFNPDIVKSMGIDTLLKGMASTSAQEVDTGMVDSLRNMLFGPPGAGGVDLFAIDIARGRDHGLADYNTAREAFGLPRVTSFSQITSDMVLQQQLHDLYGSVDNIDLFVGGLAEDHVPGSSVGPLFRRIIADQFERVRDGDRFWYQHIFSGRQLAQLNATRLSDIIRLNTGIDAVQDNVFFCQSTISGRVFMDGHRVGKRRTRPGMGGVTVQLLNSAGRVILSTVTASDGSYRFTGFPVGSYSIREILPSGWGGSAGTSRDLRITQSMLVSDINFGNRPIA